MREGCEGGGIGASDQEIFSQKGNGLVMAFKYGQSSNARSLGLQDGNAPTLNTTGGNAVPVIAYCSGGRTAISIGNGQAAEFEASLKECCQTLNCMHEVQKIALVKEDEK